jgi:hypothetical protein
MFKFTAAGRDWIWPKFTTRVVSRVRDEFKLDLRGLLRDDAAKMALAMSDDELILAVFRGLCADQIAASGLSADQIEDAWDADANVAARESLIESFFTLSQGPKRARVMMERMREAGL